MNKTKLLIFFISVLFFGCELLPDLPRDNPLDRNSPYYIPKKEIKYYSHAVTERYSDSSYTSNTEQVIKPGDRIYLALRVENTGDTILEDINAEIVSESDLVEIKPTGQFYLSFIEGTYENYIRTGYVGMGVLTTGMGISKKAQNGNVYAVEFTVSYSANKGDTIPFTITGTDKEGGSLEEVFSVSID